MDERFLCVAPVQGISGMILYSKKESGLHKVIMSGEEFKILRDMAKRVQPKNDQEREMLLDLWNEEDEE